MIFEINVEQNIRYLLYSKPAAISSSVNKNAAYFGYILVFKSKFSNFGFHVIDKLSILW